MPDTCNSSDGKTHLVVIQPSSFCNIKCRYCYVPGRENRSVIKLSLLEDILTKVFESDKVADGFRLVWHNGEPLSLGIKFYQDALAIIKRVNKRNKNFHHCIQTNGTLINQQWIDFFIENDISPSISIDGPKYIHDANRVTKKGLGSFEATIRGIRILRNNGIPLVGLCVVTTDTLEHGEDLFNFFLSEGFTSLGLIIEEPWGGNPETSFTEEERFSKSLLEQRFKSFLKEFFNAWLPHHDKFEIREFNDIFTAFRKIKLDSTAFVQQEDNSPCTVLSFNQHGGITTFSPQMIAGTTNTPDKFIVAHIQEISSLEDIEESLLHKAMKEEISLGIRKCQAECGYFQFCGGGAPASKFYEHGKFDVTETRECRFSKQIMTQVLLDNLLPVSQTVTPKSFPI